jgi:DNA mismatch repair protein MutS2
MGQVIDVAKDNVILAMGDLRSVVKLKRVQKISNKAVPKEIRRSSYSSDLTEGIAQFSPELDLRGKRGDEALYEVERYLDKALMMGLSSLKIIHGKGDGILRKMIREYLRKFPHVDRLEDEHADRGGDGITYVYLS